MIAAFVFLLVAHGPSKQKLPKITCSIETTEAIENEPWIHTYGLIEKDGKKIRVAISSRFGTEKNEIKALKDCQKWRTKQRNK